MSRLRPEAALACSAAARRLTHVAIRPARPGRRNRPARHRRAPPRSATLQANRDGLLQASIPGTTVPCGSQTCPPQEAVPERLPGCLSTAASETRTRPSGSEQARPRREFGVCYDERTQGRNDPRGLAEEGICHDIQIIAGLLRVRAARRLQSTARRSGQTRAGASRSARSSSARAEDRTGATGNATRAARSCAARQGPIQELGMAANQGQGDRRHPHRRTPD